MNDQTNVSHLSPVYGARRVDPSKAPLSYANTYGAPKKPSVAKGHDAQLMEAQQDRLPITVTLISGASFSGILVKRDRYTLTVSHDAGDEMFFKHAIESVRITRNKA